MAQTATAVEAHAVEAAKAQAVASTAETAFALPSFHLLHPENIREMGKVIPGEIMRIKSQDLCPL